MILYYSPGACSLAPHIVLHEAALQVTLRKVDLKKKVTDAGTDYRDINPHGYVPALELENGDVLTEAGVILQYLADRAPGAKLAPPNGTMGRYRLQEWLSFTATEMHKPYGLLWDPALPDEVRRGVKDRIGQRLDVVNRHLHDHSYLLDDGFSVADAYLATILGWSEHVGIDLSRWREVQSYFRHVTERPAARAALKAEGLLREEAAPA